MHKLQVVIYTKARLFPATFLSLWTAPYLALCSIAGILYPRTKCTLLAADAPQCLIFSTIDFHDAAEEDTPWTFQKKQVSEAQVTEQF